MILNYIWIAFFLIAFVVALGKLIFAGDTAVFTEIINSSFASAKTGFEISLGLTGILSLWLGIMKIGEKGGVIQSFARLGAPVFSKLFPGIPKEHPVTGSIFMNISANLLGLGNAATPLGIRAATRMARGSGGQATDELCRLVVLNTASVQLLPTTVAGVRAALGAESAFDILPAVWLASALSVTAGLLAAWALGRVWRT